MTNRHIDHIIACEIDRMTKAADPFIREGYMGMCVFLFKMYEFTSDNKYYDLAQEMLSRACSSLRRRSKVNMIDGLSGIGTSIMLFHKKGFVTGNIYEILRNIDNEIYKSIIQAIDYSNDLITLNNFMHNWGHKFIYSNEMIEHILKIAGFRNVKRCNIGESSYSELRGLEQHGTQIPNWANQLETVVYEGGKET